MTVGTQDLWTALGGSATPSAWKDSKGRLLASLRSGCCGRQLAHVYQEPEFPLGVVAGYTLTRAHTRSVIIDQVLLDIEQLAAEGDVQVGPRPFDLLTQMCRALEPLDVPLPKLTIPEARVDVSVLSRQVADERADAKHRGVVPEGFAGLGTACGRCKQVYALGYDLADWWAAASRAPEIICTTLWDMRTHAGWTFPDTQVADRLVTYERLLALL